MSSDDPDPIPGPTGPLEGSADPPEVRPPRGAVVVGAQPKPERDGTPADTGEAETVELDRARDKGLLWLTNKVFPDGVEAVAIPAKDEPDEGSDKPESSPENSS